MLLHLIPVSLTHTLHFSVSVILALSSIPSLHPVSDHTHHYLLSSSFDQSWPTGAVNCVPWRPATAASPFCVLSQPRLHPSSFSALFLQRNSSSCPSLSAKQNWLCLGAHHSSPPPILSHRQPGWSQKNSITTDNTATARKEPNKWSLLCRPNGPAFHLSRGQRFAQGLHGHSHQLLMRKTYKLQLAMTCMHHTYAHLMNKSLSTIYEMFIVYKLHSDIWM